MGDSRPRLSVQDTGPLRGQWDIYAAADVNRDGTIDLADLSLVQAAFGCCQSDPCYNADADIDP